MKGKKIVINPKKGAKMHDPFNNTDFLMYGLRSTAHEVFAQPMNNSSN